MKQEKFIDSIEVHHFNAQWNAQQIEILDFTIYSVASQIKNPNATMADHAYP